MISVADAIHKINSSTSFLLPVRLPLSKVAGLMLAEDVFASCRVPNFNQSAMDGYAFRYKDLQATKHFHVAEEIAAGDINTATIPEFNAVRIFTGAPVPEELDTVVMQEKVEVRDSKITVLDETLVQGSNVRLAGCEIEKGELALAKSSLLSPAAVGFLAGIGIKETLVYPSPSVHIIVTGKELVTPGEVLRTGQVYESNSFLLQSALKQLHIHDITTDFVGDDLVETANAIEKALAGADIILLTGGVSVGNYDFVVKAAKACKIEQLFHKVKQRPGKPLYFGKKDEKVVFGLPGN